jgi:hypothetical protein
MQRIDDGGGGLLEPVDFETLVVEAIEKILLAPVAIAFLE